MTTTTTKVPIDKAEQTVSNLELYKTTNDVLSNTALLIAFRPGHGAR